MSGIECSVFVLTDGDHYQILPEAKDYKRIGEGDTGLNTGGMGSVSPVPFATKEWMHKVEDQMLEYLQNAQGAMQNLYQIKRAAELVTTEIPQNMNLVRQSLPGHLKGTAIAMLVSDELTDATTQMMSLYPFMKQLVTSGSYNVTGADGKNQKHKVNLLNSAERYYVANEVVTRLENINTDLWLLAWQIRTMSWNDLWYGLDPDGWATVMSGKAIVEGLIYEWQYL